MVPPIKRLLDSRTASKNERPPKCQKCLEDGHWTYQCKGKQKIVSRVSRTKLLQKNLKKAMTATFGIDNKEVLTLKKFKEENTSPRHGLITNISTSSSASSSSVSISDSSSSSVSDSSSSDSSSSSDESVTSRSISSDTDSSSSSMHELAPS